MPDATGVKLTHGDKSYTLLVDHLTANDVKALRQQTGWSLRSLMRELQDDADLDCIAAALWLARRQDGERDLTYSQVADSVSYANMPETETAGEDDNPEA